MSETRFELAALCGKGNDFHAGVNAYIGGRVYIGIGSGPTPQAARDAAVKDAMNQAAPDSPEALSKARSHLKRLYGQALVELPEESHAAVRALYEADTQVSVEQMRQTYTQIKNLMK